MLKKGGPSGEANEQGSPRRDARLRLTSAFKIFTKIFFGPERLLRMNGQNGHVHDRHSLERVFKNGEPQRPQAKAGGNLEGGCR